MEQTRKPSGASYLVKLVFGLAFMLGGMYVSNNGWGTPEFIKSFGLPIDFGKTLAVIGVFLILFPVINFFYLKPLDESITDRTTSLEETFSEAESLRQRICSLPQSYSVSVRT